MRKPMKPYLGGPISAERREEILAAFEAAITRGEQRYAERVASHTRRMQQIEAQRAALKKSVTRTRNKSIKEAAE